jgi:HEPN domain-containing protein
MSDPPNKPVETPKAWIRFAEGDLAVAMREMQSASPVYHTICFLCQSASEKFLKGYLISVGWKLERTHDIVELLGHCMGYREEWGSLMAEGAVLNEYIVAGRYPGDIFVDHIDKLAAEEALKAVKRIKSRVNRIMGESET